MAIWYDEEHDIRRETHVRYKHKNAHALFGCLEGDAINNKRFKIGSFLLSYRMKLFLFISHLASLSLSIQANSWN